MASSTTPGPFDPFESRLREDWATQTWKDVSILVAVSGGPDSVALLRSICALAEQDGQGRIDAAHFNHGWRKEASDLDEAFVRSLCQELQTRCHFGRAPDLQQKEEVARRQRYDFLQRIAEENGHRYLVVAHTADDQAETVLHRILRGTGLRGLSGIPARRRLSEAVTLVRPLLWAHRRDVIEYLQRIGQAFQEDSSNEDVSFTRNRIRHELLPHLAQHYNASVADALLHLSSLAGECCDEVSRLVEEKLDECVISRNKESIEVDRNVFLSCSSFLQREIFVELWREQNWPAQSMSFEHWHQMVEAVATGATITMPGGVRLKAEGQIVKLIR